MRTALALDDSPGRRGRRGVRKRALVAVIAGSILVGRLSVSSPNARVRVIRIPQTHVVTETRYQIRPVPIECRLALQALKEGSSDDSIISKSSGQLLVVTSDAGVAIAERDIHALNSTIERLRLIQTDLNGAEERKGEVLISLPDLLDTCIRGMQ